MTVLRKITHPKIQTRIVALIKAVLMPLVFMNLVSMEVIGLIISAELAVAALLSVWYDPNLDLVGPSGDDNPKWVE